MGLNLSPRKRKASIATVNEWLGDPLFPKKTSKGYIVEEVRGFVSLRAEGGRRKTEDGRRKTEVRPLTSDLPKDPNGGPSGDLFQRGDVDALKEFLDLLEDKLKNPIKWQEAPIQKWQIDYLKQYRRHLFPGEIGKAEGRMQNEEGGQYQGSDLAVGQESRLTSEGLPDAESQKALAVRLAKHFAGRIRIDISEQQISKWKNGEGLPPGSQLPPAKLGNRFNTQAWAEWIERTLMPKYGMNVDAQGKFEISIFDLATRAEAQRKIDEGARIRIDLEVAQGKYIEVAMAERVAAGLAREYHEFWKARFEKGEIEAARQKLLSLGVEGLRVEEFVKWAVERARGLVDLVEAKCAEQVGKYGDKINAEAQRTN
jgi:hypothetical protein